MVLINRRSGPSVVGKAVRKASIAASGFLRAMYELKSNMQRKIASERESPRLSRSNGVISAMPTYGGIYTTGFEVRRWKTSIRNWLEAQISSTRSNAKRQMRGRLDSSQGQYPTLYRPANRFSP